MAIKTIRVKNFKSFKDVEVQLGNFNVLIGANASGKSNFIRVIEFLRDTQRHGLDNAISLQGGSEYLTNLNIGPHENVSVEVVVSADADTGGPVVGTSRSGDRFLVLEARESSYSFMVGFPAKRAGFEVLDERLSVKGEFLTFEERGGKSRSAERLGLGEVVIARVGDGTSVKFTPPEGVSLENYEVAPWFVRKKVPGRSLFLEHGLSFADRLMENVAIYDIDPKLPKKATPITGKSELEEDGSNLAIVLKRIIGDRSAKRKLVNFLQELVPFVSGLEVEKFADKSLLFSLRETYAKNKDLPASLISDGTINITALIVALYFERKSVAVIEEPERNVPPYLISRITAMMKDASRQKQIIVTSHNPEVVRNADIADVLLVSRDAEGFSTISRPSEQEDVKVFLQNQMGLEELFAQNMLHA